MDGPDFDALVKHCSCVTIKKPRRDIINTVRAAATKSTGAEVVSIFHRRCMYVVMHVESTSTYMGYFVFTKRAAEPADVLVEFLLLAFGAVWLAGRWKGFGNEGRNWEVSMRRVSKVAVTTFKGIRMV